MAADSDAQIVESPITTAKIVTAIDACRLAVGLSAATTKQTGIPYLVPEEK